MLILDGHAVLLRARCKQAHGWNDEMRTAYARHRWLVEGAHGRAPVIRAHRCGYERILEEILAPNAETRILRRVKPTFRSD